MRLVVGLGNPDRKYAGTRHNLGFRVCDKLSQQVGAEFTGEKFHSLVADADTPDGPVLLLKPQTYMNLSGQAVVAALRFYKASLDDLLVVCDDFNLDLGRLRFRREGSHGGHNGLRDIIARLGTDAFPRLRLGIGPLGDGDPVRFCLTGFAPGEQEDVEQMIDAATTGAQFWLDRGINEAMNQYNAKGTSER
jgi:peptidyl-tRNA hydrolase, PTH1 family